MIYVILFVLAKINSEMIIRNSVTLYRLFSIWEIEFILSHLMLKADFFTRVYCL